jgi:hypothetical protein
MTCWESTGAAQKRMRALPSRVGMYFVLAMTMFPHLGYLRVWDKLTAALEDLGLPRPSEKALRDLRRRIGAAPVRALFETIAVPLAPAQVRASWFKIAGSYYYEGKVRCKNPSSQREMGVRSRQGLCTQNTDYSRVGS